jgi:uncharacterized protein
MITVIKQDYKQENTFSYQATLELVGNACVCVVAPFAPETRDLGYLMLKQGDIFTEWFYTDRWYNVFMIHDVDTGEMKGYYCNLTRPAKITPQQIIWEDLALDVWVFPDGRTQLLDQDEYNQLPLSAEEREHVAEALREIYELVQQRAHPFKHILQTA